jgi:MFS family permease
MRRIAAAAAPVAVLADRPVRALLGAELLSTTGTAMTGLALPWFVLQTTGSPARTGLVAAAGWAPMVLLGIPAGSLVSRLGARRTMIACDLARVPLVAAVPILHALGALTFGMLVALAFAIGVFVAPHLASQRALLPELLGAHEGAVMRANAVLQAANRLPVVLGPALAGVLIAAVGASEVLLADAATFLASAALLARFVPERGGPPVDDASGWVWAGVRYVAGDPILRPAVIAATGVELAAQALFLALPILAFVEYDRDPGVAGVLVAAWGVGALLGSAAAFRLADRDPLALIRRAALAQALPLWALALDVSPAVAAGALLASGLANPLVTAPFTTLATLGVPQALRARVMLAFLTASTAAGGLGLVLAGPLAEALGVRTVLLGVAAVATVAAAGFGAATRGR